MTFTRLLRFGVTLTKTGRDFQKLNIELLQKTLQKFVAGKYPIIFQELQFRQNTKLTVFNFKFVLIALLNFRAHNLSQFFFLCYSVIIGDNSFYFSFLPCLREVMQLVYSLGVVFQMQKGSETNIYFYL